MHYLGWGFECALKREIELESALFEMVEGSKALWKGWEIGLKNAVSEIVEGSKVHLKRYGW